MTGDLGPEAYRFVEFLAAAGFSVWQTLPLGPPQLDGSPYQCLSVNAGDPRLISIELMQSWGWLDVVETDTHSTHANCLLRAHEGFLRNADEAEHAAYQDFIRENSDWLDDFALFRALNGELDGAPWWRWEAGLRDRDSNTLARARKRLSAIVEQHRFEQFVFRRQWLDLKGFANERGIQLFGDIPIFVAHDSAEVWAARELFDLDECGKPRHVAGVPPDYFSATGQRWGNPLYNWQTMQADGFAWWKRRVETQRVLFDLIRIDHFRGFEAYWAIPVDEDTAENGTWTPAPGKALFEALLADLGCLPLVAEDLGIITPEVEVLRDTFGLPGMRILQFAFDGEVDNPYLPHNHLENCVVYTGTHDNDTTVGWFAACDERERARVLEYLGHPHEPIPWPLIRQALASVARLAVVPMQDVLALDSAHRMNTPGTSGGNWCWRFDWRQVEPGLAGRLRHMIGLYGRALD